MRFFLISVLAALGAGSAALFGDGVSREAGSRGPQGAAEESCSATVTRQPDGTCRIECSDASGETCWVVLGCDEAGDCQVVDSGGSGSCSTRAACGGE